MNEKITFKVSYNLENGNILGFFPSNIKYTNIPEPNIEIDEVKYQMCMGKNVKVENNEIVEIVPTIEEILKKEKTKKLNELDIAYEQAQYIKIQNGHTFMFQLKGENFLNIERQVFSSNILGFADLIGQTIDGKLQIIKNIPKEQWNIFYEKAKDISVNNLSIKTKLLFAIKNVATQEELDNIKIEFPPIETVIIKL